MCLQVISECIEIYKCTTKGFFFSFTVLDSTQEDQRNNITQSLKLAGPAVCRSSDPPTPTWNNVPSTRVSGRERHYAVTIHSSQLSGTRKFQSAWLLEINIILTVPTIMRADKSFSTCWLPRHLISMRRSERDAMLRSRPSFWAEDGAGSGRRWQANRDGLMLLMSSLLPSHQHAAGFPLHGIMGAC